MIFFFHEWHEERVAVEGHDKNTLPRVLSRVRMTQYVEQPSRFDGNDNLFERNGALRLERFVFLQTPSKRLHSRMINTRVPFVTRYGIVLPSI